MLRMCECECGPGNGLSREADLSWTSTGLSDLHLDSTSEGARGGGGTGERGEVNRSHYMLTLLRLNDFNCIHVNCFNGF